MTCRELEGKLSWVGTKEMHPLLHSGGVGGVGIAPNMNSKCASTKLRTLKPLLVWKWGWRWREGQFRLVDCQ